MAQKKSGETKNSSRSENPFSQENLNRIFQVSPQSPDRLNHRENSWLEFKENFGRKTITRYIRTCAAFANTQGGYIVFGVGNNPRLLKGLSTSAFDQMDPAYFSAALNEYFAPEICWDMFTVDFQDKKFGMIYAFQSNDKPVIAMKSASEDIVEGEIYYRYRGRCQRIRYPELRAILDERRQKEQALWLQYLSRITQVGVQNAAILDTVIGDVMGASGARFIIDESLLPQLSFIREGQFQETDGDPTLKLVGQLIPVPSKVIRPTKIERRETAINAPGIVNVFLDQAEVKVPQEYLTQLCFESSAYLPIYYFIKRSGSTIPQVIDWMQAIKCKRQTRDRLIRRLQNDVSLPLRIPVLTSDAGIRKSAWREQLVQGNLPENIAPLELKYVLQASRSLQREEIDFDYLAPHLKDWFDDYYMDQSCPYLAEELRKAICYLDYMIYGQDLTNG